MRILFILILLLSMVSNNADARKPTMGHITVDSPQSLPIGSKITLKVGVSSRAWHSGVIKIIPTASKYIVPSSDVANLQLPEEILMAPSSGNGVAYYNVPIMVNENGEYLVRLEVTLKDDKGIQTAWLAKNVGVVAEDNIVWFGYHSVGSAIASKILHQMELRPNLIWENISPQERKEFNNKLEIEDRKRMVISRKNAGLK